MFPPGAAGSGQVPGMLKVGGTAVIMGGNATPMTIVPLAVMVNCWRLIGHRNGTRQDAQEAIRFLEQGRLQIADLVTHRYPLSEVNAGAEAVRSRAAGPWMVVVQPEPVEEGAR